MAAQAFDTQPAAAAAHTAHSTQLDHSVATADRLAVLRQRVLQLNGLTGATSGPILAVGAGYWAPLLGLGQYAAAGPVLEALGIGLALFAAYLFWMARRPVAPATMLLFGVIDLLWVAASVAVLLSGALPLSVAGGWTVAIQADVIAILAAIECYVWWRSRSTLRA